MFLKSLLFLALSFSLSLAKDKHTIANISEASGISYCENSDTLMVANDEGTYYEISRKGKILYEKKLGDYDLEGVVCHDDKIVFVVENIGLLVVERGTNKTKLYTMFRYGKKLKIDEKKGIEGLAFKNGKYYLSIQAKKKKDAIIYIVRLGNKYAEVIDSFSHGIIDAAGLQFKDDILYIVSDKKDKLYLYDLKKKKILKKIKLAKFDQEGITFDEKGFIYFADDAGTVRKFKTKKILNESYL
ncbi:hypothetical protein MNB_SV-13-913 [hydrothermal vent metagenome]|uniref:Periplasmic nitrate reductase component NapL n=1 Tax=hydrothermal vent metagenome TaxID=652676 RepID=A0A1W1CVE1_9ZZZZ